MDPSNGASSLASQLAEAVAADDPVEQSPATEIQDTPLPPETAQESPPPPEADKPAHEGRDEKGRFVPKSKDEQAKDEPAAAKVEAPAPATTPETPATAADPKSAAPSVDVPPDTWSPKGKAAYLRVADPDLISEIWKREQDMRSGLKDYKEGHTIAQNIAQACGPYLPHIQAAGANLMQAIPFALQKLYEQNSNPAGYIQQLAQSAGIDLAQLAQNAPQQPQHDPRLQIDPRLAAREEFQRMQMQQQEQEALSLITQFKADPKNIYFSNVEQQVLGLLRSGLVQGSTPAERLNNAYAKACLLNPEVSAAINAQQQREAEQKRLKEAAERAASAKRAAFDVAGNGALVSKGARDETVEQALARNMGR